MSIVDAIVDDAAPLRIACDPTGQELLDGWDATPDEEWMRSFLSAFDSSSTDRTNHQGDPP